MSGVYAEENRDSEKDIKTIENTHESQNVEIQT